MQNDVVLRLAERYNITPANVLISLQVNTPNVNGETYCQVICKDIDPRICSQVVPKSVTRERIIGEFVVRSILASLLHNDALSEPQSRRLDRGRDHGAKCDRQDSSLPRVSSHLDGLGQSRLHGLKKAPLRYKSALLFVGNGVQSLTRRNTSLSLEVM